MKPALAEVWWVLFFLIAPGLLVVRYFWPRVLPRWAALTAAGVLGGTLFYLRESLYHAETTEFAQRVGVFDIAGPIVVDGMANLQGARPVDFVLGGILEFVYLLLWLVPYGIIQILRNRHG